METFMNFLQRLSTLACLCFALAGTAWAQSAAPVTAAGGVLVGANGMTLYTFDKDSAGSGKSVCNGPCASNWPPLMAGEGAMAGGDFTIVTRDDGSRQWAVKGKPLYFWAKDTKPGDQTGDGFNKVWQTAKP
jgi:predicted lipoprotein with Yx(FWY)xxD motif